MILFNGIWISEFVYKKCQDLKFLSHGCTSSKTTFDRRTNVLEYRKEPHTYVSLEDRGGEKDSRDTLEMGVLE